MKITFVKSFNFAFLFILFVAFGFTNISHAKGLKTRQLNNLKLVKQVALRYPNKKGETFENTSMAICLTETNGGTIRIGDLGKKPNLFKSSLGIMQVRLATAKFIAKKLKMKKVLAMNDLTLANKLLSDDEFNVTIAVRYLVWLNDRTKNYFRTISRYNGGNRNHPYYKRVIKNIKRLKTMKLTTKQ